MRGVTGKILLFGLAALMLSVGDAYAWGSDKMVIVNDREYTIDDFQHWWLYWNNNKPAPLPQSPEGFVDFHLLAQQGEEMEYFRRPDFIRKVEIFLKFRTMMLLKSEEVDAKISVSDDDIEKYYREAYTPIWLLQIQTYDDMEKARLAYEKMLPYKGQPAGRLVFADLQGLGSEAGGPLAHEESKVTPDALSANKMVNWLEVVRRTEVGAVAEPFTFPDQPGKFVLLRVDGVEQPAESDLIHRKESIRSKIVKRERGRLTYELIERLKKKYEVEVDDKLLVEIVPDQEYPADFLDRPVITMQGMEISVGLYLQNLRNEIKSRPGLSLEQVKKITEDGIVSQTLITKESIKRGYEKEPPLKWGYEFYRQNHLRAQVEKGLQEKIEITEDDILEYYRQNGAAFNDAEMITYAIIEDEKEIIDKIWSGVLTGADFFDLGKKYDKEERIVSGERDKMVPVLGVAADRLVKGEVAAPVQTDLGYALIKLLDRKTGNKKTFDQVRDQVVEMVRKVKFDEAKREYLQKLRSLSNIKVDYKVWKKIVEESENESKK
ncbi:MAG: peptidyl-prolyl cis-trans isomerase [Proteobacteria bacterium]|nr:peptidyl-prolyl cis-trans isomerase [Pseudomonadota bacterium]MBU1738235.1 peptidyl-prolyl cis-trans isomerase [Pseudomonadota bacterium]